MSNIPIRVISAILLGFPLLHAPAICAQSSSAQITGSILYHERVAVPPDASINIQLQDVSIADVAAQVVAETMLNAEGRQVPIPFTLSYDPTQIDPSHRYSVRATIRSGDGMLMFTTAQAYPVLTHGASSKVSLVLRTVGHGAKPGALARSKPPVTPAETAGEQAPSQPPAKAADESRAVALQAKTESSEKQAAGQSTEPPAEKPPVSGNEAAEGNREAPPVVAPPPPPSLPAPSTDAESKPPSEYSSSRAKSEAEGAGVVYGEEKPVHVDTLKSNNTQSAATAPSLETPPGETAAPKSETTSASNSEQQPTSSAAQAVEPKAQSLTAATEPGVKKGDPESKVHQPEPALPDSPSTVAGLTAPEASPEQPEGEPEPESRPVRPKADTPLADTQWKLVQLGGIPVVVQPPDRPLTLAFSPEGRRIAGSAGCHTYIGTFTDDHGRLALNPGDMAAIGCAAPIIRREQKFVAAMHDADGYRVSGDYLVLTSKGKTLAKFKNQLAP